MKLSEQVCTPEQAKRLKELGLSQTANFCYAARIVRTFESFNGEITEREVEYAEDLDLMEYDVASFDGLPFFSAYGVAELGLMLPTQVLYKDDDYFPHIHKGRRGWYIQYQTNRKDVSINAEGQIDRPRAYLFNTYRAEYNMAESFAGFLILLLETKVITAEEVNKRLEV